MTAVPDAMITPELEHDLERLLRLLEAQLEAHERLATFLERKRQAIRTADLDALEALCRSELEVVQRLGELEQHRLTLTGRFTEALRPGAAVPLSVGEIAEAVGPPLGTELGDLAARLRAKVIEVRRTSSVIRGASEALHRHLTGLMQTVQSALSGAGTYGQRGRLDVGAPLECCVDLKS